MFKATEMQTCVSRLMMPAVDMSDLNVVQSKTHPVDATHGSQDRLFLQKKAIVTAEQAIVCSATPAAV